MRNLFFFGTLRHIPLLEIVLGRDAQNLSTETAILPDFRVSSVVEGPFPMIERDPGAQAEGLLVSGLTADDIARLDYYEGAFGYDLAAVTLEDGTQTETYLPQPGLWTAQGAWSLSEWEDAWGALSRHAAAEVMGYFGKRDRDEIAALFPRIRARAASKARGQDTKHGAQTLHGKVDVEHVTRAYSRFFALDDVALRHERFDESMSDRLDRAVFVGTDAAIVLPYDPFRDRVLLVEQIRMGPILRDDKSVWQLEPIAGGIDPGETPEQAAHREALEEAGLTLHDLEPIAEAYPSPGTSTEFFYLFIGLADLPDVQSRTGGLATEHEDIRTHILSFDDLMTLAQGMGAANMPLVTATYWLAHHRDRLRLRGSGATPEAT